MSEEQIPQQEAEFPPEVKEMPQPMGVTEHVPRSDKPENMVYVGRKNVMSYVLAVVSLFNQGMPEVKLKARGKSISCAVDATQIIKNRFIQSLQIKDIKLSTEELLNEDGTTSRVSSMEVSMSK